MPGAELQLPEKLLAVTWHPPVPTGASERSPPVPTGAGERREHCVSLCLIWDIENHNFCKRKLSFMCDNQR